MNKPLFWTGITFQLIQWTAVGIIFLLQIQKEMWVIIGIAGFNLISVLMILLGAVLNDKENKK